MNKLFIRLFVAFAAFSFGLVLTTVLKPAPKRTWVLKVFLPHEASFSGSGADEAKILQIYSEYGPAQTRHDTQFFERIETEDFTLNVGNIKMSRDADINWMCEQPTDIVYESRVDHLKVFDRVALAHGNLIIRYSDGSIREWPFADVWVKRNGTWLIQSTTSR